MCLRRAKEILNLSQTIEEYHYIDLSSPEDRAYIQIGKYSKKAIDDAVCGCNTKNAYSSVLGALLRLRLLCNNGTFERSPQDICEEKEPICADEDLFLIQQSGRTTCERCSNEIISIGGIGDLNPRQITSGHHLLCADCMLWFRDKHKQISEELDSKTIARSSDVCFSSQNSIKMTPVQSSAMQGIKAYSSKLSYLLKEVKNDKKENKRSARLLCFDLNVTANSPYVQHYFSSWIRTSDIVANLLTAHGIKFVRIDGSCSMSTRREVMAKINRDPETSVLIMTLGIGAVGQVVLCQLFTYVHRVG